MNGKKARQLRETANYIAKNSGGTMTQEQATKYLKKEYQKDKLNAFNKATRRKS